MVRLLDRVTVKDFALLNQLMAKDDDEPPFDPDNGDEDENDDDEDKEKDD